MAKELEDILDDCVTAIIEEGATVGECLTRYPQWAKQLELPLRLTAQLAAVATLELNPAAKAAAWRRLQAEINSGPAAPAEPPLLDSDPVNVHLSGALAKGDKTDWVIAGRPIEIPSGATVIGDLRAGAEVAALGRLPQGGIFVVSRIIILRGPPLR